MNNLVQHYDVVIVGAGHAGCEAALACARLGLETIVFTVSVESIALMPCNPNIGGSSKGPRRRNGKKYRQDLYPVKNAESLQGSGSAFTACTGREE